jgi:hypothetical protein
MRVPGTQARSKGIGFVWVLAALAVAAASIGIVHHASLSRVRKRAAAEPMRPIALVELKRNRAGASDSAGRSDAWRAAAAAMGRKIETYEAGTLGEIPARSYAAWILADEPALDDADFAALDSYLQLGGGVVLAGRAGDKGSTGRVALERLFPGQRFVELGGGTKRLRVTGASPLVAGLPAGAEVPVETGGRALAASSSDALVWSDAGGGAALHMLHRGGAVAWLGVSPAHIAEPEPARLLAENALRWALREPVLDLRAWPEGRPCAVLVESTSHSDPSAPTCRLESGRTEPELLRGLAHAGCRFASVPPENRALPALYEVDGAPFVAIPEPRADAGAQGSALMRELLAGYERAERIGGVYSLRADPGWRAKAGRQDLYKRVSRELFDRGAWFAQPDELADWWSARSAVRAELAILAPDRVRVRFANPGAAAARGVTARVYLPGGADTARVERPPRFRSGPRLRISADHDWIEVIAPSLDPGSEVSYTIRF